MSEKSIRIKVFYPVAGGGCRRAMAGHGSLSATPVSSRTLPIWGGRGFASSQVSVACLGAGLYRCPIALVCRREGVEPSFTVPLRRGLRG